MNKFFLVIKPQDDIKKIHETLLRTFDFPDYYGRNLDALYDMLTDIFEDTCIGIYYTRKGENYSYIKKILRVFKDVEVENPHIVFFASELCDNLGYENFEGLKSREKDYTIEEQYPEEQIREVELRDVELKEIRLKDSTKRQ